MMEGNKNNAGRGSREGPVLTTHLGLYESHVAAALHDLREQRVMERIQDHDHTVWKPDPEEIRNRLGWLDCVDAMPEGIDRLHALVTEVRRAGYTDALLLGMGGSSLAPELFNKTFGVRAGFLDFAVLDSTDPAAVRMHADRLEPAKTLIIVSTKSGSTVETLSFFKYFYNWVGSAMETKRVGKHFVAITDPGSKLFKLAPLDSFRAVFLNDPSIGGRYSALSFFGLVPAALIGVDLELVFQRAEAFLPRILRTVSPDGPSAPAARLGAILGALAEVGRDKLTLLASPAFTHFGHWVEQLIAESTGKEGKGIVPVVDEPLGEPDVYGSDRVFVQLRLDGDDTADEAVARLAERGHPLVIVHVNDAFDLGSQFLLWEMATAVAGWRMGINPFDQPNVESSKRLARDTVAEYRRTGSLPVFKSQPFSAHALLTFLAQAGGEEVTKHRAGNYVAVQAFVTPDQETDAALLRLRVALRNRFGVAVTVGYGPRYLHSTGQLHKGDAGHGLFIQLVSENAFDEPIPDQAESGESSISFGLLKKAQALGDARALTEAGRHVIRFDLDDDVSKALTAVVEELTP